MKTSSNLAALLSQALVAFTIEFDNEAERRMAHRTTKFGLRGNAGKAVWLTSLVMYLNCMKFVEDDGIKVADLFRRARTRTNLAGMVRWGYVRLAPDAKDRRAKVPTAEWVIRATEAGRAAREVWEPLLGIIEERWQERFGAERIRKLREALVALVGEFSVLLPDCMPILGWGLTNAKSLMKLQKVDEAAVAAERLEEMPLVVLLAKALLAFALHYERESEISLAIGANVLRVLDRGDVRVRELPEIAGVSKESIAMAFTFLRERRCVEIVSGTGAQGTKVARLTKKGKAAAENYRVRVSAVESDWVARFGAARIDALRGALESLVEDEPGLMTGLEPYPEGWRARVGRASVLPWFPMVLHRGGYPDGS